MLFRSINPANGELLAETATMPWCDVTELLYGMEQAQVQWSNTRLEERANVMLKLAGLIRHKRDQLALLISNEMGKVLRESMAEVDKCAACCEWFAHHAASLLQEELVATEASRSVVRYQPLGIILGIMPWNFPFWQVFRSMVPILMAGNGYVLKHAPNVQLCAQAIEQLCQDAGMPTALVKNLPITTDDAAKLLTDRAIAAVTLTGSTRAGKAVAAIAGQHLKKAVLELGGSDPFIVLPGANAERVARMAVRARMINTGQSCIAAKRFIVVAENYDAFLETMASEMQNLKMGNPLLAGSDYGPMARPDLATSLADQVSQSVKMGATLHGTMPGTDKFPWYSAAVLSNLNPLMPAANEELFGPVASVFKADSVAHALAIANDTAYGLGASIWTDDLDLAWSVEPQLNVGTVFINELVKSDFRIPFGGVKQSGFGRELGRAGILEFCNVKSIWQS